MSKKLGFSAVLGLVMGSQIGSGVFMLPAGLAPYGYYGLLGWLISGIGAICLAMVFAQLCAKRPRTGGPHVYAQEAFGPITGFFTGWTYWMVSWVSSTAVVVTCVGYLAPLFGITAPDMRLYMEIALLLAIVAVNLRGVQVAAEVELVLTALKVVPLVALPLVALYYFDFNNLIPAPEITNKATPDILAYVTLFTLWGFIGLECATTPAGAVENPSTTIPRAIIVGTLMVALIYFLNSLGVLGLMDPQVLAKSSAPYGDVARQMFGPASHYAVSIIAFIVCVGTLNAWILASGQISLGLAEDGLFPKVFLKRNKADAPQNAIVYSSIGIIPLLILTNKENVAHQLNYIIDISVLSFLYVYVICALAQLKNLLQSPKIKLLHLLVVLIALAFCLWIISTRQINEILISFMFTLMGVPLFLTRCGKTRERAS